MAVYDREQCDVKEFLAKLSECSHCCDGVSDDWALRAWQFRAEFWSLTYTDQSEQVIRMFNNYFNLKTKSYSFLHLNWPVCRTCLCKLLGISDKRFKKYRGEWERSGRKLKRLVTKHTKNVRASPKQDIFRKYLDTLAQVCLLFNSKHSTSVLSQNIVHLYYHICIITYT